MKLSNDQMTDPKLEFKPMQSNRLILRTGGLTLYGQYVKLFSLLQSRLNFSIEWVPIKDNKFGQFDSKINDWNGIIGMIRRKEIDTSILELATSDERSSVVDFTARIEEWKLHLFFQKPSPSLSWTIFLDVFDRAYWCVMVTCIFLVTCFHYFLAFRSNYFDSKNLTTHEEIPNFFGSLSQCVRAFVALDVNNLYNTISVECISKRMFTLVMCGCGMLNFYVYNSGLISYLMDQNYDVPINQLADILEKPSYKLIVEGGTVSEDYLRYARDPIYTRIWEKAVEENGIMSTMKEGEKQVMRNNKNVFFSYSPDFELTFESYPCHIVRSRLGYHSLNAAYAFNKDSKFVELFSYNIMKMLELGVDSKQIIRAKKEVQCIDSTAKYFRTLSYDDLISAFTILLFGCFIAFAYVGIEWQYNAFVSKSNTSLRRKGNSNDIKLGILSILQESC